MGDVIELSSLSNNSFEAEFRLMVESGKFELSEAHKDFLRQVFPNKTFKGGCKSCWNDAVIEYVISLNPTEKQPILEVSENETLLISENYGYTYMGVKIKSEFVLIAKDVKAAKKIANGKKVISETSAEAQAFFHENKLLHKYLTKG